MGMVSSSRSRGMNYLHLVGYLWVSGIEIGEKLNAVYRFSEHTVHRSDVNVDVADRCVC